MVVRRVLRGIELVALITAVLLHTVLGASTTERPEIHVRGNQLVDADGKRVRLFGVNRSGTEYACVVDGGVGAGVFTGPSDDASIAAMKSWHVNSVRVSLNEDCWLGLNGVNPAHGGVKYQDAIIDYVDGLNDASHRAAGWLATLSRIADARESFGLAATQRVADELGSR